MRSSYLTYLKNGINQGDYALPFKAAYRYLALSQARTLGKALTGPLHGTIFVTYACNLRCGMCDLPFRPTKYFKDGKKELSTEEMKELIDDFAHIGTTGLGFTGGEPWLRKDLVELVRYAKSKKMVAHTSSNGWYMNKENARKLIEAGLDAISFSLDGSTPETHDKSRGMFGSYDKVIEAIKNFQELNKELNKNVVIVVTCVFSVNNLDEIIEQVRLLKKLKVDKISFIPFHDIGKLIDGNETMQDFKITDDRIEQADRIVDKLIRMKKDGLPIESSVGYLKLFKDAIRGKHLPISCFAGYATVSIDSYGDIYPCFPRAEMGLGQNPPNIRDTRLREFWNSEGMKKIRHDIKDCRVFFWNNQTEVNLLFHPFKK